MSKSENVALYKYLTRPSKLEIKTREKFAKGTTIDSQLPLEEYIKIVKEMVNDPNYRPPVNLNAKEVGRIPNFEKAKALVKAEAYCNKIKPFFDKIRFHCDQLETMVDDNLWPLTKYRELLFTR